LGKTPKSTDKRAKTNGHKTIAAEEEAEAKEGQS